MKFHRGIHWLSSVFAAAALALLASGPASAQKTQLLVYTALETDQLKAYEEGFYKAVPDVELKWVRDSTGVITAKLLAEKANPQADVVMGLAATSLVLFETEGMLQPYAPSGLAAIQPAYREGKIVMPNPASSGTGYLDVTSWLQIFGEQGGWKFMDGLHENIAQYTHSGSKPCVQAGNGEFPIGISFEYRANTIKAKGGPIDLVFPKEGLGWDLEAVGIMKTTKKLEAAKKFADWASSRPAMELYAKNYAIVAIPGVAQPLPNLPADYEKRLVKNDFAWAANNREKILAEWTKRYDVKSEPKK